MHLVNCHRNPYTHSAENWLTAASGGVTLHYDGLRRMVEYDTNVSARFVYDGHAIVAEVDNPAGAIQRRYVRGDGMDELLVDYVGSGTTNRRFLSTDERGSIIATTDSNGALIGINKYDEFGVPQSGNTGRFGYTGQAWFGELGAWYYKARFYRADIGRFLQTDPIGYEAGMNLYSYVGNDPVNWTDPLGLWIQCRAVGAAADNGPTYWSFQCWENGLPAIFAPNLDRGGGESGGGGGGGGDSFSILPRVCPPVVAKVTGVGPNQANSSNRSSISQIPGNQLPPGAVAIDPTDFGQSRVSNANRSALSGVTFVPLWNLAEQPSNGAPAIPRGIPSLGPYSTHDVIGPASARNQPGFHIDLYRYSSQQNALASTRMVPVVVVLPPNSAGLKCPSGE